jgi:hypothetical protein
MKAISMGPTSLFWAMNKPKPGPSAALVRSTGQFLCDSGGDSGSGAGGGSWRLFICDCRVGTLMWNRYCITLLAEASYFIPTRPLLIVCSQSTAEHHVAEVRPTSVFLYAVRLKSVALFTLNKCNATRFEASHTEHNM